jgi:hypothetical protein
MTTTPHRWSPAARDAIPVRPGLVIMPMPPRPFPWRAIGLTAGALLTLLALAFAVVMVFKGGVMVWHAGEAVAGSIRDHPKDWGIVAGVLCACGFLSWMTRGL